MSKKLSEKVLTAPAAICLGLLIALPIGLLASAIDPVGNTPTIMVVGLTICIIASLVLAFLTRRLENHLDALDAKNTGPKIAARLWIDRSGSIPPAVVAAAAMTQIVDAERLHRLHGITTSFTLQTFNHEIGQPVSFYTTTGEPMTQEQRAELLHVLETFDPRPGGTDFAPIYDFAQAAENAGEEQIVVSDLQAMPTKRQPHPANLRYVMLPAPVGSFEALKHFAQGTQDTLLADNALRIDLAK